MREIIFRGKRIDNGKWVDGCLFVDDKGEKNEILIGYVNYRIAWEVDPETVGQYTGLTDKNGTKIFEGDIVKAPLYYDMGCYPHTVTKIIAVKIPDIYKKNIDGDFEIIGNIHDNNELLKGGADNGNVYVE